MLSNPRNYYWVPRDRPGGPPFIEGETLSARFGLRRYLRAGDGHRIPFPRRILDSDAYSSSEGCRVELYVQTDDNPYHGVDYVMEIHLQGDRDILGRVARVAFSALNPLRRPSSGLPGLTSPGAAAVSVGANILTDASPISREGNWTRRVELSDGAAVVRYDFLP